ncbi:Glycosyltransferase involved in cell wall bisynthesis [Neorhodopirellula lusitana]|uniref:Glycosyltransferase involved in cell wall bisynthesis n=2 Tax=Neorhodopirellula lusitana TaxID=445327 RepID=A0ABY1Q265_9BACT|nr:Glycosyltransferase involved in cell wall bisynthesis [Neorhodopirellula lusitana]
MKVWVDGSAFENTHQWGIWRVFYEIMSRTCDEVDYTLHLRSDPKQPLPPGVRVFRDEGRIECGRWNLPQRLRRRMSNRREPAALNSADLFHSTGFTWSSNPAVKSIITVHDMVAESHFPICIRELQESIAIKRESMQHATMLPCVSHSTAEELAAFYPSLADKSRVIHHGAEHLTDSSAISTGATDSNATRSKTGNALFVGNRIGHKNFFNLLDALRAPAWPSGVELTVVGSPFSEAEKALIRRHRLTSRINHVGYLSHQQLRDAYREAACLVFPSFQEGFGLPCLEAQSLDCPLVCSDIPVFHEVAGDAALFFDPRLGEHIADQVAQAVDTETRRKLTSLGANNLRRFSWDESGRQMIQLYEEAFQGQSE